MQMRAAEPPRIDVFTVSLVLGVVGIALYMIFPVVGPCYAFPEAFPMAPPPVEDVLTTMLVVPAVARNCMPSLHTALALVIWLHARPLPRWVRFVAGVYLVLTILATLGFGFHYLFDLIVVFPFVLAIQAGCTPHLPAISARRRSALLGGITLTAAWLLTLRYGLTWLAISPIWTAASVVFTVVWSLTKEHALYNALLACATQQSPRGQPEL
jgi:hypothetical protein